MSDFNTLTRQRHFIDAILSTKSVDFQSHRGAGAPGKKRTRSQCHAPKNFYAVKIAQTTPDAAERVALSIALAILRTPQLVDLPASPKQTFEVSDTHKLAYGLSAELFTIAHQIADSCRFRRTKIPDLTKSLSAKIGELQSLYGVAC